MLTISRDDPRYLQLTHLLRLSAQSLIHCPDHDRRRSFQVRRGYLEAPETPAEARIPFSQVEMAIGLVLIRYCAIQVFRAASHTLSVRHS